MQTKKNISDLLHIGLTSSVIYDKHTLDHPKDALDQDLRIIGMQDINNISRNISIFKDKSDHKSNILQLLAADHIRAFNLNS